jgi:hypothetical protein
MSRVIIRGLKRQLELKTPHQTIYEVIQSQEQTCFQAKGVQLAEAPNNDPQQPFTTKVPFH